MGFKNDLFRFAQTFDITTPYEPSSKQLRRDILARCEDAYVGNAANAHIAHQRGYSNGNRTGGTFDFTVTVDQGKGAGTLTLTVVNVPWNSTGANLASLLDAEAQIQVPEYGGGNITGTGTFGSGGSSVSITIDDSLLSGGTTYSLDPTNLTGGTTDPALGLQQSEGMIPRVAAEALMQLGVLTGNMPGRTGPGTYFAPTPYVTPGTQRRDEVGQYPSQDIIRLLVNELEFVEGQDYSWVLDPQ